LKFKVEEAAYGQSNALPMEIKEPKSTKKGIKKVLINPPGGMQKYFHMILKGEFDLSTPDLLFFRAEY
jgi:hypothetical protein